MANHSNIGFFVPHLGCKNRCTFCNQHAVTGKENILTADEIRQGVETAVGSKKYNSKTTEIAFFGGSFTAIERQYMITLLKEGYKYVKNGAVSGIRISTRPDCIDEEILNLLKEYGVTAIELGAQSMDDNVLSLNHRGHTAKDVFIASELIKKNGFSLGLQMMTGLYGSNKNSDRHTVDEFIKICPDTVRIYPTVILKDTVLEHLYKKGHYIPEKIDDSVEKCSEFYLLFKEKGINVIRMGLHTIDEDSFVAGPFHPAFSELCLSRIFYKNILEEISLKDKGNYNIFVPKKEISIAVGQKKENIKKLSVLGYTCKVIGTEDIESGNYQIKEG